MKKLSDFTRDEFNKLMKSGMYFEFYPEATGRYPDDCPVGYQREQGVDHWYDGKLELKYIMGDDTTFEHTAVIQHYTVEEFFNEVLKLYEKAGFVNDLNIEIKRDISKSIYIEHKHSDS